MERAPGQADAGSGSTLQPPSGAAELLLKIVGEEADRLNRIVGDLLDFARPYEALKQAVPLEPIIGNAVDTAVVAVPNPVARAPASFSRPRSPYSGEPRLLGLCGRISSGDRLPSRASGPKDCSS